MSEGIIHTSKNAIHYVMNDWMLKDLKIKKDDRNSIGVI